MDGKIGTVFNVSRLFSSKPSTDVGDYESREAAESAMVKHYKENPKRGTIQYRICQEDIEMIGGVVFRKTTLTFGAGGSFCRRYDKAALERLSSIQPLVYNKEAAPTR